MNWIIHHSKLMPYHTHLDLLLKPLIDDMKGFQWLISDVGYSSLVEDYPINMDEEYFLISPHDFAKMLVSDVQIWWAAIIGLPGDKQINIDLDKIPFVEGNALIWQNGNLQHPEACMEIDCIDSGYTIVKFTDEKLSKKFKGYFGNEAIKLERFR